MNERELPIGDPRPIIFECGNCGEPIEGGSPPMYTFRYCSDECVREAYDEFRKSWRKHYDSEPPAWPNMPAKPEAKKWTPEKMNKRIAELKHEFTMEQSVRWQF